MMNKFWEMDERQKCVKPYSKPQPLSGTPPTSRHHVISMYHKLI